MKRIILMTTAILAMWGCSKDLQTEPGGGIAYDPAKVVTFTTGAITRGTPIDNVSQMTDMGVYCAYTGTTPWTTGVTPAKMVNRQLSNNAGVWEYNPGETEKWNQTNVDDRYTFFAYAPFATGTGSAGNGIAVGSSAPGVPTLTYTVPTDVTRQPDLMVAVPKYDLRYVGKPVDLQMEHALTCVGFKLAGEGQKIKGIAIKGVSMTGTLAMDGGSPIAWTNLDTPLATTNFSASLNTTLLISGSYTTTSTLTDIIAGNGYLMMIPQSLGADAKVVLTKDDDSTVEIGLNTYTWTAGSRITYSITLLPDGTITFAPDAIVLPFLASNGSFEVICRDGDDIDDPTMEWELAIPSSCTWLTMSTDPAGISPAPDRTLSGTGSQTVYVFATLNGTTDRTVNISRGGTTVVAVKQLKEVVIPPGAGTTAAGFSTYVGAFWKKSQTGERIIRIEVAGSANFGDWSAFVAETDPNWAPGDIMLTTTSSADTGITYNATTESPADMNNLMNDATYQVTGGTDAVAGTVTNTTGNNIIYFRIGLKSAYTPIPTAPVRYATIVLTYGNPVKAQKIFLRQGEDPDYLIHPDDVTSPYDQYVKRFSPYNLTAAGMSDAVNYVNLPTNGGVFTEYPTQAGAFFKWAGPAGYERAAWHPTKGYLSEYTTTYNTGSGWNPSFEVCPTGFRRPSTAAIGATTTSEVARSLLENVAYDNMLNAVTGYYADGHFDRHGIMAAFGYLPGSSSAVLRTTWLVGYVGTLFYTETGYAPIVPRSLFLPAAGGRHFSQGTYGAGTDGSYGCSSLTSGENYLSWETYPSFTHVLVRKDWGSTLRCVVDE